MHINDDVSVWKEIQTLEIAAKFMGITISTKSKFKDPEVYASELEEAINNTHTIYYENWDDSAEYEENIQ